MKKKKPEITVIIPTINEGKILKRVIDGVRSLKQYDVRILLVLSEHSTKETKLVAQKSKEQIINIGDRLGKGTAITYAIPHIKTKFVVQIDADYQFMPYEIPSLIDPLLKGYDVVLGTRYQKGSHIEPKSVSLLRLFGSYGLSLIASIFAQQRITDVMAGFKAFKTSVLRDLNPQVTHFGYEAELAVRAAKRKYKIINIPISYKKRDVGKSTVSSFKHGFLVLDTIIKTAFE